GPTRPGPAAARRRRDLHNGRHDSHNGGGIRPPEVRRLTEGRAAALEHARLAMQRSGQRRRLITELIDAGSSQSDLAPEMGVTRQAVQKMLAAG
ncbi:MAG TPA: hypothetical protein VHL53_19715, partial [Acidimicrobiia bacterium]|nr:hypothetical protein [Acidimicrobiia bacterium]